MRGSYETQAFPSEVIVSLQRWLRPDKDHCNFFISRWNNRLPRACCKIASNFGDSRQRDYRTICFDRYNHTRQRQDNLGRQASLHRKAAGETSSQQKCLARRRWSADAASEFFGAGE
jgi:hypothetical protein